MAHSNPRNALGKAPPGALSPQEPLEANLCQFLFIFIRTRQIWESKVLFQPPATATSRFHRHWGIPQLAPVECTPSALSRCLSNTEGPGSDSCLAC